MYLLFIRTVKAHVVAMLEDGALPHIDWPLLFPRCASVVLDVDLPTGRGCVPYAQLVTPLLSVHSALWAADWRG